MFRSTDGTRRFGFLGSFDDVEGMIRPKEGDIATEAEQRQLLDNNS